MNYCRKL